MWRDCRGMSTAFCAFARVTYVWWKCFGTSYKPCWAFTTHLHPCWALGLDWKLDLFCTISMVPCLFASAEGWLKFVVLFNKAITWANKRISLLIIFSKCFITVIITVDPDPVLGTLGMRWECTLNGTQVLCESPCTYINSHLLYVQFGVANSPTGMFWEGGRNPEENHMWTGAFWSVPPCLILKLNIKRCFRCFHLKKDTDENLHSTAH